MSEDFVSIEGRVLARALKLQHMVVERRTTYPILGAVRLTADGKTLSIEGTDLDLTLTMSLDVIDGRGAFDVCVNPIILWKIARLAGAAELVIERDGEGLILSAGQTARYDLPGAKGGPAAWPGINGERGDLIESFDNGQLAELLTKVHWCISTEETRYYLNGVAWQDCPDGRRFAATDGHRMALCVYRDDIKARAAASRTRIIPRKTVALLRELARERVAVHSAGELVLDFVSTGTIVRTKLIDGQYPDVDRVLPKREKFAAEFKVARDELAGAIERAMVFDGRDGGGRMLKFDGKPGDRMTVGARHADQGGATIELSTLWPAAGQTFGLNGRYLRDVVLHCVREVSLHQVDAGAPLTVLDADPTMTRLVMPMRV